MKNMKIALGFVLSMHAWLIHPMEPENRHRLSVQEEHAWKFIGEKKVDVVHGNKITFASSNDQADSVTHFHFTKCKNDEDSNPHDNKEIITILGKVGVTHGELSKHQEAQAMVDLLNKLDDSPTKTVAFAQGTTHWAIADSTGAIKVNAHALRAGIVGNMCDGKGACTLASKFKTPIIALEFSEPMGEHKALYLAALAEAAHAEGLLIGEKVERLLKIWKYSPMHAQNQKEAGDQ